jgi:cytochrome c-type biogenesis protein CcmH
MTGMRALPRAALLAALMLAPLTAAAVQPDEIMADPAMEARARDISKGLRCLVCRNESIDDSNATLARDLRLLVRERLAAGDTDEQVIDYVVDRYGEYVLLQPTFRTGTRVIWLAGPAFLLLGGAAAFLTIRRARPAAGPRAGAPLSEDEKARLDALLKD